MVDSRCGLHCTNCGWKESHGCGGCIETMGHPFHGKCPIAACCQNKGYEHCGECDIIPCSKLFEYSYLDPEHGDKPQGARVEVCRRWAAESGKLIWNRVLLTSAGWGTTADNNNNITLQNHFLHMLNKDVNDTTVLFIPTAAIDDEEKKMALKCRDELLDVGIQPANITTYNIDGSLSTDKLLEHDVIYITGGNTEYLLKRIKESGFDDSIKKMVYAGKTYVGVSAGSLIATPNIGEPFDASTAGLGLVNAYLSVHSPAGTAPRTDLPLPHIPLTDRQALFVSWDSFQLLGK